MTNIQKVIKYSLICGFIGAVLFPFIHESYANIGKTFSLAVLAVLVLAMTIRLSTFSLKEALFGITVTLAVSSVLGSSLYFIVHESIVDFLEKNSRYFYLGMDEHFRYYAFVSLILLSSYILCLLVFGVKRLIKNRSAVKDYIDNAFDNIDAEG